jgi:hypothetical protein
MQRGRRGGAVVGERLGVWWPWRVPPQRKAAARANLKRLKEQETANVLKQQALLTAIEEASSNVQSTQQLLQMFCNRYDGAGCMSSFLPLSFWLRTLRGGHVQRPYLPSRRCGPALPRC